MKAIKGYCSYKPLIGKTIKTRCQKELNWLASLGFQTGAKPNTVYSVIDYVDEIQKNGTVLSIPVVTDGTTNYKLIHRAMYTVKR
jgi:hypothetical protein